MRKPIVAGNWKMNKTLTEGLGLITEIKGMVRDETASEVEVIVFPSFISLQKMVSNLEGTAIRVGAQNMHAKPEGAYTGEVSGAMIQSVGCTHVLVGHSERRMYFAEDNSMLHNKLISALELGLIPVYCVGETIEERDSGSLYKVIEDQIRQGLGALPESCSAENLVLAYEPVWAIGTGRTASVEQAQEVHQFIRQIIAQHYSSTMAEQIRILYGGSVKASNAADLFAQPDIDGGLIGGAALMSREFVEIIKAAGAQCA